MGYTIDDLADEQHNYDETEWLTHPRLKSGELRSSAKADWG